MQPQTFPAPDQLTQLLQAIVQQIVVDMIKPIQAELAQLKAEQGEWVTTKEAMRLTGIKQAETLKAERERKGTLLVFKFEGTTGKLPRYLRSSILAYNERKTVRRIEGRDLAA